ncbi:gephyrin-like molybdotransferase Glp [Oricola sp.]|uniref:molybdopterin molybdotransferase MoeA n=1 Tax=Oricola sp. TaxID=1979950 RepID=UPI0025E698B6|nr:gephyrin-like molybdotransferase Glp [Oricola sp.]MCI5076975.1 molybdopterin molybdotransferase MoeA [Oricola sp.]
MKTPLIPVAEARDRLLADAVPFETESVAISDAYRRILGTDLKALRTQPPQAVSAMDGYAVRSADIQTAPTEFSLIGEVAAGHPFDGTVGAGETVRIFTGGVVPQGADTVMLQENVTVLEDGRVRANQAEPAGRHVRPAGLDFRQGETVVASGTLLDAGALCLAAAANHPDVPVIRRPRVGILATGDELLLPGSVPGPGQIIASNSFGIAAMAKDSGAEIVDLGIARDTEADLVAALDRASAEKCDVLVTLGGASVGDHDLVQKVFVAHGMTLDFWRIAMRPGKPLMFGRLGELRILGLPGNPVSALVCGLLFMKPLLERLGGRPSGENRRQAVLETAMTANGLREDYVRAETWRDAEGALHARPFTQQDSSMISTFAQSTALIVRPPHAPASEPGDTVDVLLLKSAAF